MAKYNILKYLPPYGPKPEHIGWKHPREGFVVEFIPDHAAPWVGNFAPVGSNFNGVVEHPNGKHFIVIAGGQAYVIDPETRQELAYLGSGTIDSIIPVPELKEVVFGDWFRFVAIDTEGKLWETPRIAVDGMRSLHREGLILYGEASDQGDSYIPFQVDLMNGVSKGGIQSYKFREDQKVRLISFNGLVEPNGPVPTEENYFLLIGKIGVVKQSPKEKYLFVIISKKARLLIKFDVDLSKMELIAHNEIENAL